VRRHAAPTRHSQVHIGTQASKRSAHTGHTCKDTGQRRLPSSRILAEVGDENITVFSVPRWARDTAHNADTRPGENANETDAKKYSMHACCGTRVAQLRQRHTSASSGHQTCRTWSVEKTVVSQPKIGPGKLKKSGLPPYPGKLLHRTPQRLWAAARESDARAYRSGVCVYAQWYGRVHCGHVLASSS
jgi:hypothetical protein